MTATSDNGAQLGRGFVCKQSDGSIAGEGDYCGFPIAIRLEPDEQHGKRGYRVMLFQRGAAAENRKATAA